MLGKSIVTAIVGGNSHDGTRSVSSQYIVTYIYRYILARNRIDGITAGEYTTHLLINHALAFGLVLHLVEIGIDGFTLIGRHYIIHIDALGSQYHKGNTEDGIGTRGENQ